MGRPDLLDKTPSLCPTLSWPSYPLGPTRGRLTQPPDTASTFPQSNWERRQPTVESDIQKASTGCTRKVVIQLTCLPFRPLSLSSPSGRVKKTRPKSQGHLVKSSMPLPPHQPDLTPLPCLGQTGPRRARIQGGSHSRGERPGCRPGGGAAHKSGPTPTQSLTSGAAYPPTRGPCLWAPTAAWSSQLAKASRVPWPPPPPAAPS